MTSFLIEAKEFNYEIASFFFGTKINVSAKKVASDLLQNKLMKSTNKVSSN